MRVWFVAMALVGCGGDSPAVHDAPMPDADPCQAAPVTALYCAPGALGQISLDGQWTFNGQRQVDAGSGAYTTPMWLERTGTGWCHFGLSLSQDPTNTSDPATYVDDTAAIRNFSYYNAHGFGTDYWKLCVSVGSDALHYHEDQMYEQEGAGQHWITIDGVLTR